MQKPKEYDWKDSNISEIEAKYNRELKQAAAESEKAWEGIKNKVGIRVWRIEKFIVRDWPKKNYGKFFDGDSYIILHCYKDKNSENKICYDAYFWIGKESTQDDYGTAAYKVVELDNLLNDGFCFCFLFLFHCYFFVFFVCFSCFL